MLVDWENLKYSLSQRGLRPNVAALRSAGERFGRIVYARAYADWQDAALRDEASGLYTAGLEPVYVPTRRYQDGGEIRVKDSVDVKLTADCIEASHQYPNIGTFVIVSGDHGFLHVVNTLRPRGKQVVIVGVSWSTARQLTEPADVVLYYDLDVDKPLSETAAAEKTPQTTSVPQKITPQIAQAAETIASQVSGTDAPDKRALADVLNTAMTVVREFREAARDLSVSSLGQEMQKRMPAVTYAQQVKGKLQVLVQSLAANGLVRLASRDLQDYLYLPDEKLPEPRARPEAVPHFDIGSFMYSDLRTDERGSVIKAIDQLSHNRYLDFLTFKRIQKEVAEALGRDEWSVQNLTNSMVSFGVIRVSGRRREMAEGGYAYEFDTFELNDQHEDVRRALG
jgi:uncharacterized LabA/DUF88 family protein